MKAILFSPVYLYAGLFVSQAFAQDAVAAPKPPGAVPLYKNPKASIEDRVKDLLPRMSLEDKVSQLIQGDLNGWMNMTDPLDNTLTYNKTGLVEMMKYKSGSIWAGYATPWEKFVYAVTVGQKYLMENTTLGIPALIQSEGLHGFTNNGTIWPSPIALACSFNTDLVKAMAKTIADEAEGLGINHIFAPVLDLGRELRWGRVEEGFGEDPFLTGEMGYAYVTGLQTGARRNTSSTAIARMAATCKHFAAFGSPQGGLNLAPVQGGERELRTQYLKPFSRACLQALSMMTAYSSYDGVPAVSNYHLLTEVLRNEWGYKYWVTTDAASIDFQTWIHGTCETRECAAKNVIENGLSGEMGGGTYTYLLLPDLVKQGVVDVKYIDQTVSYLLRTKFALGLFENPYPYADYRNTLRTASTQALLHQMEQETIVLLENRNNVLPLKKTGGSVALIGPAADQVLLGDYVFYGSDKNGISPLAGFKKVLANTNVALNYAEGCKLWSNDQSGFPDAVAAAQKSDVAVVVVGTWSRDQTLLWQGLNATTGEHVDSSDLGLVGAQRSLVQAIKATGKPTVVVMVAGRPLAEPWIAEHADAIISQFYGGEMGGLALAEVIFGDVNPSGKISASFPRSVGTAPAYYNYLKGARPLDPGSIGEDGTLKFGHQYILDSPVPLWSFGYGKSYTTFKYSGLSLSKSSMKAGDSLQVTVTVANTGNVKGKEVVQVYMTDTWSSVVTPVQHLVGFKKVEISPGQSSTVSITIPPEEFTIWSGKNKFETEAGEFLIKIGSSQDVFLNGTVTMT